MDVDVNDLVDVLRQQVADAQYEAAVAKAALKARARADAEAETEDEES